jgi:hypothetical protein
MGCSFLDSFSFLFYGFQIRLTEISLAIDFLSYDVVSVLLLCCSENTDRVCGVFVGGGGSRERFLLAKTGAAVVGSGEDSEVLFFWFLRC